MTWMAGFSARAFRITASVANKSAYQNQSREGFAADKGAAGSEKGLMDISPAFIADREATIAVEPGQRALDHPAMATEPLTGVDPFARDADTDVARGQGPAAARNVVALVGVQLGGPFAALPGRRLRQRD